MIAIVALTFKASICEFVHPPSSPGPFIAMSVIEMKMEMKIYRNENWQSFVEMMNIVKLT